MIIHHGFLGSEISTRARLPIEDYAYDEKGNRISKIAKVGGAVEAYTYDSQNRLVGYASDTTVASYAYDAMERRIAKTVDGVGTAYVYDMSTDDPLAMDDITLEFSTGAIPVLNRRWAHSNAVDEPVGFEEYAASGPAGSGTERLKYADRQGSILWVTDPVSDAVVAAYEYEGFGELTQTQGTLVQPYGYTGREYDPETGLYYFRARYLDTFQGDFLQSDPIGFDAGPINIYEFAMDNPYNLYDPSGLTTKGYIDDAISEQATSVKGSTYAVTGITTLGGKLGGAPQDLTFGYDLGIEWHNKQGKFISTGNGYCSSAQHAALQAAAKAVEGTHKCVPYAGNKIAKIESAIRANRVENLRLLRRHSKFAIAQSNLNAICYAGGDEIHRAKVQDALKNMTFCRNSITLLRKNP